MSHRLGMQILPIFFCSIFVIALGRLIYIVRLSQRMLEINFASIQINSLVLTRQDVSINEM